MRRAVLAVAAIAAIPVLLWCLLTLFLSIGVPVLASGDKAVIRVRAAWLDTSGNLVVDHLHVESGSEHDHWWVDADRVTAEVDPHGLRDRIFKAKNVHAEAASFHYEAKPMFTDGGPARPPESKWTIALDDVTVDDVRELSMGDQRLVDAGRATGDLTVDPVNGDKVRNALLEVEGATFFVGQDPVMTELQGQIGILVDSFLPRNSPGVEALAFLSGNAQMAGKLASLSFLERFVSGATYVQFAGGSGPVDFDLKVTRGVVEPGSRLHVTAAGIEGHLFSYVVTGDGVVDLDAVAAFGEHEPQTKLEVAFEDFAIQKEGAKTPHLQGKGLVVTATGPTSLYQTPDALDLVIDLPESKIPDLRVYNEYLPTAGLSIDGGTGRAVGHLEIGAIDRIGKGRLDIFTHDAKMKVDDVSLEGDVVLRARVPSADLEKGRYEIGGTKLSFDEVSVTGTSRAKDETAGWWAILDVPSGHVQTGGKEFLDATLALRCRDSVPFVAVLSELKPVPGWARGMLATDNVKGEARLQLGKDVLRVDDLDVQGGATHVMLEATKRDGQKVNGIAYAKYRGLAIGVRMHDAKQEIQITNPRKWYDGLAEAN